MQTPRLADRRAASGCLWDACEALLGSHADPEALPRALDSLLAAFDCDGVALHAVGPQGRLEPWCARGDWQGAVGDLRECIGVPLFRGRERVGALDLRGRKSQRWTPDHQSLVRTASGALGAALGARLELDRLRRAPGRDAITGLADGKAFQQRLLEEFGRAQRSGVPLAMVTLDLDHFGALNARYGKPAADQVLAECALVLKVALRDGDFLARLSGDQFGVLLPDCDLAPARRLAERLRHAPGRDAVTGLADGKAFQQRLLEEFGRAHMNGVPLAVVTIDLDHFAALNGRYGQPAGDPVLAECALVLKVALRDGDFLARLSGDEFGVILPDCDLAPARRLAERLRHAIEEHRFARAGKLSCSAGVAASPRDGLDATELLSASEQALGLAKKAGRHRTASNGPSHTH